MPEQFFADAVAGFRVKRDFVLAELAKIPGITCPKPEGAFYVFPVISSYYGTTTPDGNTINDSSDVCVFILDVRFALDVTTRQPFQFSMGAALPPGMRAH